MRAADVMTPHVISVSPDSEVREIASLLIEHGISAVPVVDEREHLLGIVSEGDLIRRLGEEEPRSWWLRLFAAGDQAADYVRTHGRLAREIMTPNPVTVEEDEPLHRIAALLERRRIKRVPVLRDGRLVGIVSRSNLLRGFSVAEPSAAPTGGDRAIRDAILEEVDRHTGVMVERLNIIVADGRVQLWGLVDSQEQRLAVQVAAENAAGVRSVENNLGFMPRGMGGY
ncbi:CBS domain-containing protein [Halomonas organivorans]|uniref:CBS domain-containing protein n=1 Tax=Halomonas organivorans TaxID=257772 RepID=A0A7W5C1V2_9GAMM|nr:CBS domain-containing protein [Halomonas organivorans]MBB3143092.1 CBS domain-containing protein [Halomonas organivorans]